MQDFINWFSDYGNLITSVQVLATGVIAFATVVLWLATRNLARVTKPKPFVIGYLESSEYHPRYVNFVIINTGNAPAFDIEVNVFPALPDIDGKSLEGETETVNSVFILPPNQKFSFQGFDTRPAPMEKFDVTISWASRPKSSKREVLTHSIRNIGNGGWEVKGLDRIARELEKIAKNFRNFKPIK